ncbi:hypothetical protein AB0M79_27590 [Polymorphospora sp. NPDC051019]|uniref:hypothetical protein n=1 Tax=Polymorphospora sp. NPDC051019 TaxID=3155725 RepID=UPI00343930FB
MANHRMRPVLVLAATLTVSGCFANIPEPDRNERIDAECKTVGAGYALWTSSTVLPKSALAADVLTEGDLDQLEQDAAIFKAIVQPYTGKEMQALKTAIVDTETAAHAGATGGLYEAVEATHAAWFEYDAFVCS